MAVNEGEVPEVDASMVDTRPMWERLPDREVTAREVAEALPNPYLVEKTKAYGCYGKRDEDGPATFSHLLVETPTSWSELEYLAVRTSDLGEPLTMREQWVKVGSVVVDEDLPERPWSYWRARKVAPRLGFTDEELKSAVEPTGVCMWGIAERQASDVLGYEGRATLKPANLRG